MPTPPEIIQTSLNQASEHLSESFVKDAEIKERVEFVCRCIQNRAGARILLGALLAKISDAKIDIRKPYTEIAGTDTYSGRRYDESYIASFINRV